MRVGFNYPWAFDDYGFNFGPRSKIVKWATTLPANLARLDSLGVSIVRWFILANASNYGPEPARVVKDGKTRFVFDPPTSPDATFFEHFRTMLNIFKNFRDSQKDAPEKMQLIPSFVDFGLCMDIKPNTAGSGRADLVRDPAKRDHFFRTMLDPMLDIATQGEFKNIIFAFEVMNEPCWLVRRISPPVNGDLLPNDLTITPVSLMQDFLRIALDHIRKAGLPSTVGHRFASDLDKFALTVPVFGPDAIGTIPQFHYYPDPRGFFPPLTDTPGLPPFRATKAILGEFKSRDDNRQGGFWQDCHGSDVTPFSAVHDRLGVAKQFGYELAMPWPDLDDDGKDSLKLSPIKQLAIQRFLKGGPLGGGLRRPGPKVDLSTVGL